MHQLHLCFIIHLHLLFSKLQGFNVFVAHFFWDFWEKDFHNFIYCIFVPWRLCWLVPRIMILFFFFLGFFLFLWFISKHGLHEEGNLFFLSFPYLTICFANRACVLQNSALSIWNFNFRTHKSCGLHSGIFIWIIIRSFSKVVISPVDNMPAWFVNYFWDNGVGFELDLHDERFEQQLFSRRPLSLIECEATGNKSVELGTPMIGAGELLCRLLWYH